MLFFCITSTFSFYHLNNLVLGVWKNQIIQVRERRAELEKLKSTFVRRASEFLRNYFASLVDFMISDKSYFSQVYSHFIFCFNCDIIEVVGDKIIVCLVLCSEDSWRGLTMLIYGTNVGHMHAFCSTWRCQCIGNIRILSELFLFCSLLCF